MSDHIPDWQDEKSANKAWNRYHCTNAVATGNKSEPDERGNKFPLYTPARGESVFPDAKWSGHEPIPKIGEIIKSRINKLGRCKVVGYFTEYGWLGVHVELLKPPAWWKKQNGSDVIAHLYGAEIE